MDRVKQEELQAPFPEKDLEWRVQSSGKKANGDIWAIVLVYVTNRAIQDRLDNVFGVDGWQNEYRPLDGGGYLCGISCKFDNEWITKWDGSSNTDIEAVKGGLSGSMKRAGSQWGIGRYLYRVKETWANITDTGSHRDKLKDKTYFKWNPPKLPSFALPSGEVNTPPVKVAFVEVQKAIDHIQSKETTDDLTDYWNTLTLDQKRDKAIVLAKEVRKSELEG